MTMRLCSTPGCGRAVQAGVQLCDECRTERTAARASAPSDGIKVHRPPAAAPSSFKDGIRMSGAERAQEDAIQREYTLPRWRKGLRPLALQRNPFCADCPAAASEVHHKIPVRVLIAACLAEKLFPFESLPGFYILENLIGLCKRCHTARTRKEKEEAGKDWTAEIDKLLARFRKKPTFSF
jgi:5-methylcytosine-specific restriction endonuclease McrA